MSLDWDPNRESDLDHYRVYRGEGVGPTPEAEFLVAQVDDPRYLDHEVVVGTVYHYIVTAVDKGGKESLASQLVSDVPLAVPELEAPIEGVLSSSTPVFRWNAVPEALNYRVVVTSSPVSGEVSDMPLTNLTTANFVGRTLANGEVVQLESGQIYYWKVIVSTKADGLENSVSRLESFKVR